MASHGVIHRVLQASPWFRHQLALPGPVHIRISQGRELQGTQIAFWNLKCERKLGCRLHGFPEDCIYPLLQTAYDAEAGTFSNPPGVTTSISDFGGQFCAPIPYEPLFVAAQAVGYTIGEYRA